MKNEHITIISSIIVVSIFFVYFYVLYIYANVDDRMKNDIIRVQQASIEGNTKKLENEFNNLLNTWNTVKYIVSFNFASEEEYHTLSSSIDKIQGSIIANDNQSVIIETVEIQNILNNFTKIVPEP